MKYLLIIAMALPLLTACVHHHRPYHDHRDGPGNSENAPGHNKDKHDHKHKKDKHD